MSRTITLSLPVAIIGASALAISLISHIISFTFYSQLNISEASERAFPISIQSATLTTVKSGRFGLFANDSDWDTILPSGDGFIYHPEDGQHYLVAHYHQLHCLHSMRKYLNMAMVSRNHNFSNMDINHVHHCLIYLRQLALCNVDLTLEPASHKQRTPDGKVADTVTGVGVTHRCRDWSQVRNYMEENFEEHKDTYKT